MVDATSGERALYNLSSSSIDTQSIIAINFGKDGSTHVPWLDDFLSLAESHGKILGTLTQNSISALAA